MLLDLLHFVHVTTIPSRPPVSLENDIFKLIDYIGDKNSQSAIKILNDKGYTTKFCCSGHYDSQHPNGYISFEYWVELPSVPKGFMLDEDGDGITIRTILPYETPTIEDFKTICDNAKILLDWAISLPDFESD